MFSKIEIDQVLNSLLSVLDEEKFFKILSSSIAKEIGSNSHFAILLLEGANRKIIGNSQNYLDQDDKASLHVFKTKMPYFSNNIVRDPLFFSSSREGIESELIFPLLLEGEVFATLHFQNNSQNSKFSMDTVEKISLIISTLILPIKNLKLYLDAKYLNCILLKKMDELIKVKTKKAESFGQTECREPDLTYRSNIMSDFLSMVDKVSKLNAPIMLQGENSTGKEILAKRIHCRSERKSGPFFSFNCATSLGKNLEKEIFGYEELDHFGKLLISKALLEKADNGTLLLKNIHLLSIDLQNKLIDFIKEGKANRIGGIDRYRSNARIICTINSPIEEFLSTGVFMREFSYFFNLLKVPALRQRKEDIEILATKFLNGSRNLDEHKTLSPCLIKVLKEYSWPGNIRELKSIMEEAYLMADGLVVERIHLPHTITDNKELNQKKKTIELTFLGLTLGDLEKKHIVETLEYTQGNKTKTAKILGITVKTLYNKLHSYGMISGKV